MLLIYRSRSIVSKYQKQCMKVTRNTVLWVLQQVTRDENRLFAPNEQAASLHLMLNQQGWKQNRTTLCILLKHTQVLCWVSYCILVSILVQCCCSVSIPLYTSALLIMLLYTSALWVCYCILASITSAMLLLLPKECSCLIIFCWIYQQCWSSMCTNQIFQHSTEKLKKSWSTDYPLLNTPARAQIKSANTGLKS